MYSMWKIKLRKKNKMKNKIKEKYGILNYY